MRATLTFNGLINRSYFVVILTKLRSGKKTFKEPTKKNFSDPP